MASEPTLPTLDGEPREPRDGDRVLWSDDVIDTVKPMTAQLAAEGLIETTSRRVHSWTKGIAGPTIILILGPSEQDNGDGTVTKVTPIAVTMGASLWDEFTPVAHRDVEHREMFLSTTQSAGLCKSKVGFDHNLVLRPKTPTPSPFEVELARRVSSGAFVLPRQVVQEFANALYGAVKDIGEWVQLAKRQRREMFLPDCNPLCPTDAAISASKRRTIRACKAIAAISDLLPEDPQAQGGDDE